MKAIKPSLIALSLSFAGTNYAAAQTVKVDPEIPSYKPTTGVTGNLNSVGSDTLNNLMALWTEGFKKAYPSVVTQVEGKGSSTAPPALIEGTAQLGPMSREMKATEIDEFEKKFGYKPTAIPVAIDALAFYVHKDNPIEGLSLKQLDSVFSSTYKRGGKPIATWGEAGLDKWGGKTMSLYGRNSASGTYGFVKKIVLQKGDYKATVKEQPGSSAVVQGVATDLAGIGYSGIGYRTSGVRALPLSETGGKYFEPNVENCLSGDYPLARFLLLYVNKKPGQPLDKLTQEFINYVLSKEGQEIVVKDKYFPLPAEVVKKHTATK